MTGRPGEYSSIVNSASKIHSQSFGANVGLRFFLGKGGAAMNISHTTQSDPAACNSCSGSFALHGLPAGAQASVSYKLNGAVTPVVLPGTVAADGALTVPGLCAGSYTDIQAGIGNKTAGSNPVTLTDPKLIIGNVVSQNPSAAGACDGSITVSGIVAGQKANITYSINGRQASYTNTVSPDQSIRIPGLCAGTVTDVQVAQGTCTAQWNDRMPIVLAHPKAVIQAPPVVTAEDDQMSQILFAFNTSDIRPESYAVLDRAYAFMQQDSEARVIIDGNTDKIGSDDYNQKLSERRAAAVKAYLMKRGISAGRISQQGNGERSPVATNNTGEGRRQNRRAELLIRISK
jgi:outer membrane protein OmpA-like peptidoglycan-associated protein